MSEAMKKNAFLTMFLLVLNFALWGIVTSSGAIRASFFIPIICFAVMFAYATVFGVAGQTKCN